MRGEELLEKMTFVDPAYLEAADRLPQTRKKTGLWMKYAAAACLALLFAVGIPLLLPRGGKQGNYIVKHVPALTDAGEEIAIIPRWEDMIDCQRYAELRFGDAVYGTQLIAVHAENIGARLGETECTGYDVYEDTLHSCTVSVYAVRGIRTDAAVCVKFREEDEYAYAYANREYTPASLGELAGALDFDERLETGLVYDMRNVTQPIVYEDVPSSLVWELLLSDPSVMNEPEAEIGRTVLSIAVSVDVLGNHYKTFSLTEDGYLRTNLLETGKVFRIGEDRVNAFVKTVTENYQGYLYIFDTPTGDYLEE